MAWPWSDWLTLFLRLSHLSHFLRLLELCKGGEDVRPGQIFLYPMLSNGSARICTITMLCSRCRTEEAHVSLSGAGGSIGFSGKHCHFPGPLSPLKLPFPHPVPSLPGSITTSWHITQGHSSNESSWCWGPKLTGTDFSVGRTLALQVM